MNPETNPVTVDTPYGKLYVSVIAAQEDSYHSMARGNVTELRPRVRVASDPTFEADPNHEDHWTIRRRAYAVHQVLYFHDKSDAEWAKGTSVDLWHTDTKSYDDGFRNDMRAQVSYDTKTYDLMRVAVTDALVIFAEANPGWEDFSLYLLQANKRDSELYKVKNLRAEADQHEAKAKKFDQKAGPLFERVPESLRALMRT